MRRLEGPSSVADTMKPRVRLLILLASVSLPPAALATPATDLALVNRLSWGETAQGDTLGGESAGTWLQQQLHPSDDDGLPPQVAAQIDAMEISHRTPSQLNDDVRGLRETANRGKGTPDASLRTGIRT